MGLGFKVETVVYFPKCHRLGLPNAEVGFRAVGFLGCRAFGLRALGFEVGGSLARRN